MSNNTVTEATPQENLVKNYTKNFAQLMRQAISYVVGNDSITATSFSKYTKDDIIEYLRSPSNSARNLRLASMEMYSNSPHYRRLIQYNSLMPLWAYTIVPYNFDIAKAKPDDMLKSYTKVCKQVENFNIKHEMQKAVTYALRDGIFYGAIWANNNSWFIQRLDPSICYLTSVEDGTYIYAVDFSQIKEANLPKYPPEFTTLWNTYKSTGQKKQEIPSDMSFCLKADETIDYPFPPFAGLLPSIYDLANMQDLATVATELDNYKLLNYIYDTKDGVPTMPMEFNQSIYNHIANSLPQQIGLAMTPKELKSVDFERTNNGSRTDEIEQAISNFWYNTGMGSTLFGNPNNTSAASLSLSIKTDEQLVYSMMNQVERVFNRLLKNMSGSQKWKINILPVTWFNVDTFSKNLKDASTQGFPVKTAYAAVMNIQQTDINAMAFLENDVLNLPTILIPTKNSYTQPSGSDDVGAPIKSDDEIGEAGEQTRDNGGNENK